MLNLTPEQIQLLKQISLEELTKRCQVRFNTTADDEENIRRQIYLDGGIDMIEYLLSFDRALTEKLEEEKQSLLQSPESSIDSNQPPLF